MAFRGAEEKPLAATLSLPRPRASPLRALSLSFHMCEWGTLSRSKSFHPFIHIFFKATYERSHLPALLGAGVSAAVVNKYILSWNLHSAKRGIQRTNNCTNNCLVTSLVNAAKRIEKRGPVSLRMDVTIEQRKEGILELA